MARLKLNTLKRARIRQNWNKQNVYNLFRFRPAPTSQRNFFQQKFTAKQETRRYHGEHVSERKWNNIFRHTLKGVVTMNPKVMALSDGSEAVSGRGAGDDVDPDSIAGRRMRLRGGKVGNWKSIPFMQMCFAPLERRLDVAVYRAVFASSVRQARGFVTHGKVSVNGKKMPHAGYMLNPGDMFSIDPLLVMRAIGNNRPSLFRKLSSPLSSPTTTTSSSSSSSKENPPSSTQALPADLIPTPNKYPNYKIYSNWQPKKFMNLFAYIPRYLEVNHNICHAVYLRHPVARAGGTEIPNPFPNEIMGLAFNWYLRRR